MPCVSGECSTCRVKPELCNTYSPHPSGLGSEEPVAEPERPTDSEQCQEQPLGGSRLPVQPPLCRPGSGSSRQLPPVCARQCRLLLLFTLCLYFAALPPEMSSFPASRCPTVMAWLTPLLLQGAFPDHPEHLPQTTQPQIVLCRSPRVVSCLCIDMSGVYILSPGWCHRLAVPATCLQISQFLIKKGEVMISLFNEEIEAGEDWKSTQGHSGKV